MRSFPLHDTSKVQHSAFGMLRFEHEYGMNGVMHFNVRKRPYRDRSKGESGSRMS